MTILAILAVVAFFLWVVRGRRPARTPEDDGRLAIDRAELEAAEAELAEDSTPRSLGERGDAEDPDDWGPGTAR